MITIRKKIVLLTFVVSLLPFSNNIKAQPVKASGLYNLGKNINSRGDDFSPSVTADGKFMVFNSRLPEEPHHNIYFAVKENGSWSKPKLFSVLNSEGNDETPYITPDGKAIVFSSDREGSIRPSVTSDGRKRITYDIYISYNTNGNWSEPVPVPGEVNTFFNERSPSLSADKTRLYFTRWPFGRINESRIYEAFFEGDSYSTIKPLPEFINKGCCDVAFMPSHKTEGFYFSSIRPEGKGGFDIYYVPGSKGKYKKPINLGSGVNSPADEIFLTEGNGMIYLSSNRSGGFGKFDLYAAEIPGFVHRYPSKKTTPQVQTKPIPVPALLNKKKTHPSSSSEGKKKAGEEMPTVVIISVKDGNSGKPLSIDLMIYLKKSSDPGVAHLRVIKRKSSHAGIIRVFPRKDVNCLVVKNPADGFKQIREIIPVKQGKTVKETISLYPVKHPEKKKTGGPAPQKITKTKKKKDTGPKAYMDIKFKSVLFRTGSSSLDKKAKDLLKELASHLKEHKNRDLKIIGHGDTTGSLKFNRELSKSRARAVRNYLKKLGIAPDRMSMAHLGSKYPVATNGLTSKELTRRVEFRFIIKNQ